MRSLFSKAVVAAAIMTVAIGGTTRAQSGDNDGCSNATLNGDYAFTVSGSFITTPPGGAPVTVERLGVAMTHFNGKGGLTQVDYVASNVPPPALPGMPPGIPPTDNVTGFHINETGTYTVHSDCTGTFTIDFPEFSNGWSGAVIETKFVLANHGRSIYTVVTSLTPPGPPGSKPVPLPMTSVLISSEGHKL
jgi:hypothetical protein